MKAALIKLHIAVFLWGFTGVLGKTIQLNEGLLVWYRLLITVVSLFILMKWKKEIVSISFKQILQLIGIGAIVALHWVFFYGSIKYANVSIALICLSSAGVMTALLEPLLLNKRLIVYEVLLGLIAIAGIYLIFHFDTQFRTARLTPVLAPFEQAFSEYALAQFIRSKGSQNYVVFERTYDKAVQEAIANKPLYWKSGFRDYYMAPWS
jgi:drug/metabolite transporter (DMT)-like permease